MKKHLLTLNFILIACFTIQLHAQNSLNLSGNILDENTGEPLPYANICLKGKMFGTISNEKGEFLFNAETEPEDSLLISYLGYHPFQTKVSDLKTKTLDIQLKPSSILLDELVVKPLDAVEILKESRKNRKQNYHFYPINHLAFYRETIKENEQYFEFAEGILELYKKPGENYQIKLLKGRRNRDIEKLTSSKNAKITIGGPHSCLNHDIINYKWDFFQEDYFDEYEYRIENTITYNHKPVYVISFDRKNATRNAIYKGKLFVDKGSYAIVKANFRLNEFGLKKDQPGPIIRGIMKLFRSDVVIDNTIVSVSYEERNGKWTLKNIAYDFALRLDRKKKGKLKNYTYLTHKDIVILSSNIENPSPFPINEILKPGKEFGNQITSFDKNFWENYNYLKPSEALKQLLK